MVLSDSLTFVDKAVGVLQKHYEGGSVGHLADEIFFLRYCQQTAGLHALGVQILIFGQDFDGQKKCRFNLTN